MIWNLFVIPNVFRFPAITSAAALDNSTKYTIRAPRLSASMPTAPVPAYKSNHVDSASAAGSPAQSTLNSVSRSRSAVGRISSPGNDRNVRRRYCPAITLMGSPSQRPRGDGLAPSQLASFLLAPPAGDAESRVSTEDVLSAQPFRFA